MRNARVVLVFLGCALFAGCVLTAISGSGHVVDEPRSVSGFSAVSLSGSGRLLIEQGETESLTITADDNLLPLIKSEVSGGRLELGSKDSMTNLRPSTEIVYKLTVKNNLETTFRQDTTFPDKIY